SLCTSISSSFSSIFFFTDTAATVIYTLSLHDALPICLRRNLLLNFLEIYVFYVAFLVSIASSICIWSCFWSTLLSISLRFVQQGDRKSTRLNSSHVKISYAVFCLKKKKKI